jgi:hypothetical protein
MIQRKTALSSRLFSQVKLISESRKETGLLLRLGPVKAHCADY